MNTPVIMVPVMVAAWRKGKQGRMNMVGMSQAIQPVNMTAKVIVDLYFLSASPLDLEEEEEEEDGDEEEWERRVNPMEIQRRAMERARREAKRRATERLVLSIHLGTSLSLLLPSDLVIALDPLSSKSWRSEEWRWCSLEGRGGVEAGSGWRS